MPKPEHPVYEKEAEAFYAEMDDDVDFIQGETYVEEDAMTPDTVRRRFVYYAHCIALYGTPQEERDLELLHNLGFRVYNPNNEDAQRGYQNRKMEFFKDLIQKSGFDALVFRALPDGGIPAGVWAEIDWAREAGLEVFELPANEIRRRLPVAATRAYLKEVGHR